MRPTNVTASILCKAYGRAKKLEKAFEVLELIESRHGEKPNCVVYTCLIQACVQNAQVNRGWDLFHRMIQSGLEPDAVTFGALIHGCVYSNRFDLAMGLVRRAYCVDEDGCSTAVASGGKVVHLQPEVMKVLSAALTRKMQTKFLEELTALLARNPPPKDSEADGCGEKNPRPAGGRSPQKRKQERTEAANNRFVSN